MELSMTPEADDVFNVRIPKADDVGHTYFVLKTFAPLATFVEAFRGLWLVCVQRCIVAQLCWLGPESPPPL